MEEPPPTPPTPAQEPANQLPSEGAALRDWSMWLHLSGLASYVVTATPLIGLVAPIVIWQMKKDVLPGIEPHGRNAMNFHLSLLTYALALGLIGTVFTLVTFGLGAVLVAPAAILFGAIFWIAGLVFPILAALDARKEKVYRYPLTIDFVRLFTKS